MADGVSLTWFVPPFEAGNSAADMSISVGVDLHRTHRSAAFSSANCSAIVQPSCGSKGVGLEQVRVA